MSNFIQKFVNNFVNNQISNWYAEADKILNFTVQKQGKKHREIEDDFLRLEDDFHNSLLPIFIGDDNSEKSYEIEKESIETMIKENEIILLPINNMVNYYYSVKLGGRPNPIELLKGDELTLFYIYYIVDILCSNYTTDKYNKHNEAELNLRIKQCIPRDTTNDMKIKDLTALEIEKIANKRQKPNPTYRTFDRKTHTLRSLDMLTSEEMKKKYDDSLIEIKKKSEEFNAKIANLNKLRSNKSIITHKTHDMLLSEIKSTTGKRKRSGSGGKKKARKTKKNKKM